MLKTILITGSSRGLGKALALELAAQDVKLLLWARDQEALAGVAKLCTAKGADVEILSIDLTNCEAIVEAISKADSKTSIDVAYINAGLFDGARSTGSMEILTSEIAIIDLNLRGAIALSNTLAGLMRTRKRGHIVFISSLAARFPLADAAAYSASKAGLSAYAECLRQKLHNDGIKVSDVQPGHIATDMTMNHQGALPMLQSPEKAAALIVQKVRAGRPSISFPWPLNWGTRIAGLLPAWMRLAIAKTQRFTINGK